MERALPVLRLWWLPLAFAGLAVAEVVTAYADRTPGEQALMLALLLPLTLMLALRFRWPGPAAVAAAVLVGVFVLVAQGDLAEQPPVTPFLVLLVTFFGLGLREQGQSLLRSGAAATAAVLALQVTQVVAGRAVGNIIPSTLLWLAAFAAGRIAHRSLRQAAEAGQRAAVAEADREAAVVRAAAEERRRIARELHDVLAHSLSAIVVQASVEARLLPDRSSTTAETLDAIERAGREALVELRHLLGLLRAGDEDPLSQPLPSLAQLDTLVESLCRSGHDVRVDPRGDLARVPAGAGLSAYRVVQEAVTNALKHAPGSPIRIVVEESGGDVEVWVENGPTGSGLPELPGGGHGLVGMKERTRMYGGSLDAGATPDGGFRVRARFPRAAAPSGVVTS